MTDAADTLAAELSAGIAAERTRQRAPELERELAFTKAGIPLDKPYGRLFAEHYDGPLDPDEVIVEWYRVMVDEAPPAEVLERIRDRQAEANIARFRAALDSPHPGDAEPPETGAPNA